MSNPHYTELLELVAFAKQQAQEPQRRGPKANVHGLTGHPIYKAWGNMLARCTNPNAAGYRQYGGRGIRVCRAWESFLNFLDDMGPTWEPGLTLDRIEPDGDYTPRNCRWASRAVQAANRRTNVWVATPHGVPMILTDAEFCYGSRAKKFPRVERPIRPAPWKE